MILVVRQLATTPGDDEFGNPVKTWVERDWPVRAVAPGSMEESDRSNRDLSVVAWTVYADKGGEPGEHDQVGLPGDSAWYTVEGRPEDWTMGPPRIGPTGPFPTNPPGVVVELRRADG